MIADDFQPWPGGLHHLAIDAVGEQAKQPIYAAHTLQDDLAGGRQFFGPQVDLAVFLQQVETFWEDPASYKYLRFCHGVRLQGKNKLYST